MTTVFFCPHCSNLLLLENAPSGYRFYCQTCPYLCDIKQTLSIKTSFERKKEDVILGGEDDWAGVPTATARCPKCEHDIAFYKEMQTRSADEPATLFFKCKSCGHQWNEF